MKRIFVNVTSFAFAGLFAISLAIVASAQSGSCDYLIGNISDGATCYYSSQDAEYCYYDCYCVGTQSQCDAFYRANGLF